MKPAQTFFKPLLLAAALGLGVPAAALAYSDGHDKRCETQHESHTEHGPGGRFFMGERGPVPPFLRGIDLSDSQSDQVFDVMHARAPSLRANMKALRQAQRDLRQLALSDQYDEARAKALTETIAKASSSLSLMRSQDEHRIWELLTPEQRQKIGKSEDDADFKPVHGGASRGDAAARRM